MPEWVPGVKQAETLENWAIYLAGIGTAFVLWQLLRRYWLYMLVLGVLLLGIAAFIAVL